MGNFVVNFNIFTIMEKYSGLFTENGQPILTSEYVATVPKRESE